MSAPDFLVVGHTLQDLVPGGSAGSDRSWQAGGAVAYASAVARSLGLRTAVLTAAGPEIDFPQVLPGVEVEVVPAAFTTQFENTYEDGRRQQRIPRRADVTLGPEHLPEAWGDTPIVLLGPVTGEIDDGLAAAFPRSIVGIGAQGWLRELDEKRNVRPLAPDRWECEALLETATALFVSDEDIPVDSASEAIERWRSMVEIVAFTRGDRGADVYDRGERRQIGAFPAEVVDLTGAGDVFAAAFLIRLHESGDVWEATRYGACAASFIVEGEGVERAPTREEVEGKLGENAGVVARAIS